MVATSLAANPFCYKKRGKTCQNGSKKCHSYSQEFTVGQVEQMTLSLRDLDDQNNQILNDVESSGKRIKHVKNLSNVSALSDLSNVSGITQG